ncbi:hypothetical protein HHX48_03285 [Salinimonas sp. HHU 13199]|uniref:Uncharacterized protein n=1 Tax=Salinimonas profundi TaxID=2729140 RepID=A0ABR8LKD0_9ALTE|nr:hypothetical protein [Salinimonas profundi]MBD3584757.1 hypothetical protein [Salinimonas profundi]
MAFTLKNLLSLFFFSLAVFLLSKNQIGLGLMFSGASISVQFLSRQFLLKEITCKEDLLHKEVFEDCFSVCASVAGDSMIMLGVVVYLYNAIFS